MATTEELEAKLKRLERELQVLKDIEAIKQLKGQVLPLPRLQAVG